MLGVTIPPGQDFLHNDSRILCSYKLRSAKRLPSSRPTRFLTIELDFPRAFRLAG